ncbi:MAG: glycosyltransferase family 2 protein [Thermoplasmatota archaeon]
MDKLSILISSFNRPDLIGLSIESILSSNIPEGLDLEIVVVDDQSNDETWEILKRYNDDPRFIIYRNPNKTGSGGPNWSKGFELSSGNIVTNNEDDMIWHKDYIRELYQTLKKHDKYTCVFGMYIQSSSLDDLHPPRTQPTNPSPNFGLLTKIPHKYTDGKGEHVAHNEFFCYREFFDGLDELWHDFPGSGMREETDLYLRTLKLDPPRKYITNPRAYLWHVHSTSGKYIWGLKKRRRIVKDNHKIFLKRNYGKMAYIYLFFTRLYIIQKWIRDMIGHHIIEPLTKNR